MSECINPPSNNASQDFTCKVIGLNCTNCALALEKHLRRIGATKAAVDFATGRTTFTLPSSIELADLVTSIKRLGYSISDTHLASDHKHRHERAHDHSHNHEDGMYTQTLIAAGCSLPMLFAMFFSHTPLHNSWVQFALATPPFIIGLKHFGASAIRSIRGGAANMDVLIVAGILAGYIASVTTLLLKLSPELIFFEAVGSIVTFILIGHVLESRAVRKTTSAIEAFSQLQPQQALRLVTSATGEERAETIHISQLSVGDMVRINSGDKVPTDAVIVEGSGSFDESMITGESLPIGHTAQEKIIGGTILLDGSVRARAISVGEDTTLASIVRLVQDAQQKKPQIQRIGDAVSAVFVPGVLVVAVAVIAIGLLLFDFSASEAIVRGLAIVVIACPCAMGLATPTAIMVALGRAASNGILIRGGDTLERLGHVQHIAFDKTGTLTRGELHIDKLLPLNGVQGDEAAAILVGLQSGSSHPIAASIRKHYAGSTLIPVTVQEIRERKGIGIEGILSDGTRVSCGGPKLMDELGVRLAADLALFKGTTIIATLTLRDKMRAEAPHVISQLHALGLSTSMISGDRAQKCSELAGHLGIEAVHAEQLPEEKLQVLRAKQQEKLVAFVGDGINDAPTLAEAAVGISVASASDVAIHSAQVLLSGNSISALPKAVRLARITNSTIKQNLFWALFYNVIAIPFAALGFISPVAGALIMTGSDVIIVANSLRIKYRRISE
jgi:Cu+-exporting ATPase